MGVILDKGHSHDVHNVQHQLTSKKGEKGASVSVPLVDLANAEKDHDSELTTAPKDMRSHLKDYKEKK